jgi:hypothetical protein
VCSIIAIVLLGQELHGDGGEQGILIFYN